MPRQAKPTSATNSTGKIPYSRFQEAVLELQQEWENEGVLYYPPLDSASWTAQDWADDITREVEPIWEQQSLEAQERVCNYLEKKHKLKADIFHGKFVRLTHASTRSCYLS